MNPATRPTDSSPKPKATREKKTRRHRAKAPPGYMSIPAFGKKVWGLERTASYAAARRGEIPIVTLGQDWVPPNWEELLQRHSIARMDERQREYRAKLGGTEQADIALAASKAD